MDDNFTAFQMVLLIFGAGSGVTICGFAVRYYINSIVRPKLYDKTGQSVFITRAECDKSTTEYRKKVCGELKDIKKLHTDQNDQMTEIGKTLAGMKGYYKAQGVDFD